MANNLWRVVIGILLIVWGYGMWVLVRAIFFLLFLNHITCVFGSIFEWKDWLFQSKRLSFDLLQLSVLVWCSIWFWNLGSWRVFQEDSIAYLLEALLVQRLSRVLDIFVCKVFALKIRTFTRNRRATLAAVITDHNINFKFNLLLLDIIFIKLLRSLHSIFDFQEIIPQLFKNDCSVRFSSLYRCFVHFSLNG